MRYTKPEFRDFVKEALTKWREVMKSLGGSEMDERQAFTSQILEGLLKYDHTKGDYQVEERGIYTDIAVYDNQHNKVLAIETKRSDKDIDNKETEDQSFGYASTFTRYVITSNFREIRVYKNDKHRTLVAHIDFQSIINRGMRIDKLEKSLLADEYASIDFLRFLSKEEIFDESIFNDFEDGYLASNVSDSQGFSDLISTLEKCISYLFGYALRSFSMYENKHQYYDETVLGLEEKLREAIRTKDSDLAYKLRIELDELRRTFQDQIDFRKKFNIWKETSQRVYKKSDEYREAFCREAAYVLLNKILFIRVCEDKKLLSKKISNGGIAKWKEFTEYLRENYKDLLKIAYSDASYLYDHIYQRGIFDWYQYGNSELDDILKRIFWNLNHFDFVNVDKDIMGHIYERYLSPDQRKALGEFYTPPQIVKYILDAVDYEADNERIRGQKLIDLGCGSGGFLVEALNRLIMGCEKAGVPKKSTLEVAIQGIYGFDIDYFAVHISEMNLAFRLVDIYKQAKSEEKEFMLPRLNVYQTNSLKLPESKKQSMLYSVESLYHYLKEKEDVVRLKKEKFFFIVGNPPYVTKQLTAPDRSYYLNTYRDSIHNRPNLYRLFIHRAAMMMEEGGFLGFIVPNTWIADTYARAFRLFMRENFRIKMVIQLPEKAKAFYKVTQATTILILQRDSKSKEDYSFKLGVSEVEDLNQLDSIVFKDRSISDVAFGEDDAYKFVLSPYDIAYSFIRKIRNESNFLVDLVEDIQSGEIRQVEVKDNLFDSDAEGRYVVVHGDNIEHFFVDTSRNRKDAMWYVPPAKKISRDEHSQRSRIIIQRISNMSLRKRIKAAFLNVQENPLYVENGANYILSSSKKVQANYLLGLLNSSTLNQYFKLFSSNNNIQPSELKRLPIKKIDEINQSVVSAICDKVDTIIRLKYEFIKYNEVFAAPSKLVKDGQSVYNAPILKYPSLSLQGAIRLKRNGKFVYVSVVDYFECKDEEQARVLEILISNLKDLSELNNLIVPKTKDQNQEFIRFYEKACRNSKAYPVMIERLEKEIDKLVYQLYELSSDEIDLVEKNSE